jgi:hypothetical protein
MYWMTLVMCWIFMAIAAFCGFQSVFGPNDSVEVATALTWAVAISAFFVLIFEEEPGRQASLFLYSEIVAGLLPLIPSFALTFRIVAPYEVIREHEFKGLFTLAPLVLLNLIIVTFGFALRQRQHLSKGEGS